MIITAVDPGLKGGFAVYDTTAADLLAVYPMPVYARQLTRAKSRNFLDEAGAVATLKSLRDLLGAELMCIEAVGGIPGQSAAGAFTFGEGCGIIVGAARAFGYRIERAPPNNWKRAMRVPSSKKPGDKTPSRARASEVFPRFASHWGRVGQDGLAEAALIAKFAAEHLL